MLNYKWIPHWRLVEDLPDECRDENKSDAQVNVHNIANGDGSSELTGEFELKQDDEKKQRPWYKFFDEYEYSPKPPRDHWWSWYSKDDTPEERRLLVKIDILLCFYTFVAYWVKYLDQSNINNAYVSGMKKDLHMEKNDLIYVQTVHNIGAIVFHLPFIYLFFKAPCHLMIPLLDLCWGVFTLAIYKATTIKELLVFRFFVGVFEAGFFPACHFMFGNWYKPTEYGRRGAVLYFGQMLGVLTSSLLQAAAYRNLNGVNGLAGWRWMFIINAIITFPVGIIGFFSLPGTPDNCYSIFLTDDDIRLARKRLRESGISVSNAESHLLDWRLWQKVVMDWRIYVFSAWNVLCWTSNNASSGAYLLWLKSLKKYSTSKLNNLGAVSPALGILWIFLTCTGADVFRSRWGVIMASQLLNLFGNIVLAVWDVPIGLKWFAFLLQYFGTAVAPVVYGWLNDMNRSDLQMRTIMLLVSNVLAVTFKTWTGLLVWKTVDAPRYLAGFTFTSCCIFGFMCLTTLILYLYKREERKIWGQKRV